MSPVLLAYIPVLHEGYRRFFERYPDARKLYIFGNEIIASYEHLVKDIRKLDPELVRHAILAWKIFDQVMVLDPRSIIDLQQKKTPLIVSDDDLTQTLIQKYFSQHAITRDSIFLRWDKKTAIQPVQIAPDVIISEESFDQKMMEAACEEGKQSRDWWRRIGALALKDGAIILRAHNQYVPSEHIAYDEGDPRSNFKAGELFESSLALHAEAAIVASAAQHGISLQQTDIYSETFPCPPCAKLLAYSGIKRLYYRTGYSVLDGERILKSQGVQIIFVQ